MSKTAVTLTFVKKAMSNTYQNQINEGICRKFVTLCTTVQLELFRKINTFIN